MCSISRRRNAWISSLRYQTCQVVSRRRLPSSSTLELFCLFRQYRLTTTGRRSFPVAAAIVWNTLPVCVQSSPSLSTLRQRIKTFFFNSYFPHIKHTKKSLIDWLIWLRQIFYWFSYVDSRHHTAIRTVGILFQSLCGISFSSLKSTNFPCTTSC